MRQQRIIENLYNNQQPINNFQTYSKIVAATVHWRISHFPIQIKPSTIFTTINVLRNFQKTIINFTLNSQQLIKQHTVTIFIKIFYPQHMHCVLINEYYTYNFYLECNRYQYWFKQLIYCPLIHLIKWTSSQKCIIFTDKINGSNLYKNWITPSPFSTKANGYLKTSVPWMNKVSVASLQLLSLSTFTHFFILLFFVCPFILCAATDLSLVFILWILCWIFGLLNRFLHIFLIYSTLCLL